MYNNALTVLLVLFIFIIGRYCYYRQSINERGWLALALLCWPLFMLDEWMRLWNLTQLVPLYGLTDVFGVLLMTCCYRVVKPMLIAEPSMRLRLWIPLAVTAVCQSTVLLIPLDDKIHWLNASPSGSPLTLWPAYLASLLTGFSVLLMGILITEHIQLYHRYLPEQAVDVKRYRIPWLVGIMGSTVGITFISILLVTAAMFGFFSIPYWESLYHSILGVFFLLILFSLTYPRVTSPSPLNYQRLNEGGIKPTEMRAVIEQAERVMIDDKSYKILGLTLKKFCEDAGLDPTSLAVALQLQLKKNFRRFVYDYRLEYAKKVLLRSDEKIENVAKRLGLNTEKFLGEVLVKYLQAPNKTK